MNKTENYALLVIRHITTGKISRVWLDGTLEGFEEYEVMDVASPFIRRLLSILPQTNGENPDLRPIETEA